MSEKDSGNMKAKIGNFDDFKLVMNDFKEHFVNNYSQFQEDITQNFQTLNDSI